MSLLGLPSISDEFGSWLLCFIFYLGGFSLSAALSASLAWYATSEVFTKSIVVVVVRAS